MSEQITFGEIFETLRYMQQLEDQIKKHQHDRSCNKTMNRKEIVEKLSDTIKQKQTILNNLRNRKLGES